MKRLQFTFPNNLGLFHEELLAAIPALRPLVNPVTGRHEANHQAEGLGDDVWLTVADNVDEATIATVIQAHDPRKLRLDPSADRRVRLTELMGIPRSDWTATQVRELLELALLEIAR